VTVAIGIAKGTSAQSLTQTHPIHEKYILYTANLSRTKISLA